MSAQPSGSDQRLRWHMVVSHVPATGEGGGMVRYAVEIAAALNRRPDITLSVTAAPSAVDFFAGLLGSTDRVRPTPRLPVVGVSAWERFGRGAVRAAPHDIVHGTKHLLPRRSGATRVMTVHDMMLFDRPRDFGPVKRTLLGPPYLGSIADADVLLTVSEATRQRLVLRTPGAAARSVVVPLAVSANLLDARPEPVTDLIDRRFALVVGDPSHRKNLAMLVDSWAEVAGRIPGAVLAVAGPPSWAGSSRGAAFEQLRAQRRLVHLGRISDGALRWCYENAAVALCPSLLEGFGIPAVEALAFGTPLITSTDPALCEASGDLAPHLPPTRPDLWVGAIVDTFRAGRCAPLGYTPRTWDEVAEDTVRAVRGALGHSSG